MAYRGRYVEVMPAHTLSAPLMAEIRRRSAATGDCDPARFLAPCHRPGTANGSVARKRALVAHAGL